MKRAFTLLELLVVVIIIGILAALGVANYNNVAERSRASEARANLGTLRSLQLAHFQENNEYATLAELMTTLPAGSTDACTNAAYYFQYECDDTTGTCTAHRCAGTGGKPPGVTTTYNITLDVAGAFGS